MKSFDKRNYKPCGILNSLQVELGGKTVSTQFEVIDEPLDYNLLLGRTWFYAMAAVVSTYFQMITFHHKGSRISINQLTLFSTDSLVTRTIPLVVETPQLYHHVGIRLLKDSPLM